MATDVFTCTHRVTYADCTLGNHVYYGRYLELLETARGEFFRSVGRTFLQWQEAGVVFPVIELHLAYKGAARYDDLLRLELWLTELRGIRLSFGCRVVTQEGRLILEGTTQHVCASLDEKPRRLPAELVQKLQPFLHVLPVSATAGASLTPTSPAP